MEMTNAHRSNVRYLYLLWYVKNDNCKCRENKRVKEKSFNQETMDLGAKSL